MCRELDELGQSISQFARRFDANGLTPAQAGVVVRACARLEASIASVKALAVARHCESEAWKLEGFRSPAEQLAAQTGMSPSRARRVVETGRRMAAQPEVAQAGLAGDLSAEQVEAVADGVAASPGRSRELIERARRSSLPELNEEVARVKATAGDAEARRRTRHAKRSFRRWTDRDGGFHASFYGHPEDGVLLWQALDPIRRRLILDRRGVVDHEPLDTLDYDALVALAGAALGQERHLQASDLTDLGLFPDLSPNPAPAAAPADRPARRPAGPPAPAGPVCDPLPFDPLPFDPLPFDPLPFDSAAGAPPGPPPAPPPSSKPRRARKLAGRPAKVIVRVDLDTLLRGCVTDGELCEITGYGPVPVSVVEGLIQSGNAFLAAALTRGRQLVGTYHHGRFPRAHEKTALDFIHPTCAVKGCNARASLESDHRIDWAATHYTAYDLLDRLCPHHHRLKTHKGWALVPGTGKRDFVPPGHPHHPATAGPPTPAAPHESEPTTGLGPAMQP